MSRPDPSTDDTYLLERARKLLAEDGRVGELELELSILKDKVVVSGTVQNEVRRQAVGKVLADLCPGYEILNETTVLRPAAEPEEERLA